MSGSRMVVQDSVVSALNDQLSGLLGNLQLGMDGRIKEGVVTAQQSSE